MTYQDEQESELADRVITFLRCESCGERIKNAFGDACQLANSAFEAGWRIDDGDVICKVCAV